MLELPATVEANRFDLMERSAELLMAFAQSPLERHKDLKEGMDIKIASTPTEIDITRTATRIVLEPAI
jgi:hypothetical protein